MGKEIDRLVKLLLDSLGETLSDLSSLSDADLDEPSDHPCAMGGTVRDLLTHNIDHERMHVGQVYSARYSLKTMQKDQVARLLAETFRARADLIASLIGLPEEALDERSSDDSWTIREMIEHTVYWERHSVDDLVQKLERRLPTDSVRSTYDVRDPIYGPLPRAVEENTV
jgi:uncharacterized damage-inducible protein DinB